MHSLARPILSLAFLLITVTAASAQESRFTVGVKGGATIENSEDALTGTVPALGVTVSAALAPKWRGEFEFWLPGYLEDFYGEPKHRDILFSASAVRMFRDDGVRPFLVAGLSVTRTQDWFTFCTAVRPVGPGGAPGPALVSCDEPDLIDRRRERNDGTDGYLLFGGGVEIPIAPRLRGVVDLRMSLAPVSVLLRPGVGLVFTF